MEIRISNFEIFVALISHYYKYLFKYGRWSKSLPLENYTNNVWIHEWVFSFIKIDIVPKTSRITFSLSNTSIIHAPCTDLIFHWHTTTRDYVLNVNIVHWTMSITCFTDPRRCFKCTNENGKIVPFPKIVCLHLLYKRGSIYILMLVCLCTKLPTES